MAKTQLKATDLDGFMRASWELQQDMQKTHGVVITVGVLATRRRGVYQLLIQALRPIGLRAGVQRWRYACEYPTAAATTLEASLFVAFNKLDWLITHTEPDGGDGE